MRVQCLIRMPNWCDVSIHFTNVQKQNYIKSEAFQNLNVILNFFQDYFFNTVISWLLLILLICLAFIELNPGPKGRDFCNKLLCCIGFSTVFENLECNIIYQNFDVMSLRDISRFYHFTSV